MARLARRAHLPPHRAVQQDAVSLPAPGQPGAPPPPHLHQQAQAPRLAVDGEDEVGPGEVGVGGGVLGVGAAHQEGLPGAGDGGQGGGVEVQQAKRRGHGLQAGDGSQLDARGHTRL